MIALPALHQSAVDANPEADRTLLDADPKLTPFYGLSALEFAAHEYGKCRRFAMQSKLQALEEIIELLWTAEKNSREPADAAELARKANQACGGHPCPMLRQVVQDFAEQSAFVNEDERGGIPSDVRYFERSGRFKTVQEQWKETESREPIPAHLRQDIREHITRSFRLFQFRDKMYQDDVRVQKAEEQWRRELGIGVYTSQEL